MALRDSLTPDQAEVLCEVLNDALESAEHTLKLHEDDSPSGTDIGDEAEAYVTMIAMQTRRIATIKELILMMG